jgi:uncharacterized protein HemY
MEQSVKWEDFLEANRINPKSLPDNVKHKIDVFEQTFEQYEETDDDDDDALRTLEARLSAMDNGILSDLQTFVAQKKKEAEMKKVEKSNPQSTQNANNGGQITSNDTPPTSEEKPSWAFWM